MRRKKRPRAPRAETAGERIEGVEAGSPAAFAGFVTLVTSEVLLDEFEEVLRAKFGARPREARAAVALVRQAADVVRPDIMMLDVVKADPDDNAVLECAVWGEADVIVTGDKAHLLPLKAFRGIPILSPREFVAHFS